MVHLVKWFRKDDENPGKKQEKSLLSILVRMDSTLSRVQHVELSVLGENRIEMKIITDKKSC